MNTAVMQGYAPFAAAALVLLVAIVVLSVRRRHAAAEAQAHTEADYAEAVDHYRDTVGRLLERRGELVAAMTGFEATDDETRERLRMLRQGVTDAEILLPEPPQPPAPVARLSRRARGRAEAWRQTQVAELPALRRLAELAPAAVVPAQVSRSHEDVGELIS